MHMCLSFLLLLSSFISGTQTDPKIILKPVQSAAPAYPEHLKNLRIRGEVVLMIAINETGRVNVVNRGVVRKLHPELDQAAIEAVEQWKYEPILRKDGKPIRIVTFVSVVFDPGEPKTVVRDCGPADERLTAVLDQCWNTISKLEAISYLYVCRESSVIETRPVVARPGRSIMASGESGQEGVSLEYAVDVNVPELGKAEREKIVCDYQLTSRNHRISELRTPARPQDFPSFPVPLSFPPQLFGPGLRSAFCFALKKPERFLKNDCDVIEITARDPWIGPIRRALVWASRNNHHILKAELEFNESVLDPRWREECRREYLTPSLTAVYEFGIEKIGFRFPSRTRIRVEYSALGASNRTEAKAELDIRYDQYRFFNVETDPKIIKTP